MEKDILYWVWLSQKLGAGSTALHRLLDVFGTAFDIYSADAETLAQFDRGSRERYSVILADKNLHTAEVICRKCEALGVEILTYADSRYPNRLRAITDPPAVLYCRGLIPQFNRLLCISVVGTRKMSEYGCRVAYKLSYELASAGVITVSGLAMGIDGIAACASLAAKGHTVAVLGCGIDIIYPKCNTRIYNDLLRRGTIMSEYPPGTDATRFTFPLRNRIISGLCQGTFVVEGDSSSGSMITARRALIQGREVFALPGNIGEANSNGTNELIKNGAHAVNCTADIIKEFMPLYRDVVDDTVFGQTGFDYDSEVLKGYGVLPEFRNGSENSGYVVRNYKNTKRTVKQTETTVTPVSDEKPKHNDGSKEAYAALSPELKKVYDRLPSDNAVSVDKLTGNGIGVAQAISALTMLELYGLVTSLPGGLYLKN